MYVKQGYDLRQIAHLLYGSVMEAECIISLNIRFDKSEEKKEIDKMMAL
jgi:hypothetical protein